VSIPFATAIHSDRDGNMVAPKTVKIFFRVGPTPIA